LSGSAFLQELICIHEVSGKTPSLLVIEIFEMPLIEDCFELREKPSQESEISNAFNLE